MRELWNRIIHYKFHIGWVFGFLLSAMTILMTLFVKEIIR
jgi:hypothetical protein